MHVFETPGSVSLQVKLPSGRVLVTTADQPSTTVEVVAVGRRGQDAIDEIDVTLDDRPGRHVVKIEQRDRFRWGPIQITWGGDFECRIVCPPGTDLEFSGGSTDLRADGALGEVSVRTASGDIRVESASRELQAKTASGDISVDTIAAQASLATVSGDDRRRARRRASHRALGLGPRDDREHLRRSRSFHDLRQHRPQGDLRRRRACEVRLGRRSYRCGSRNAYVGRCVVGLGTSRVRARTRGSGALGRRR